MNYIIFDDDIDKDSIEDLISQLEKFKSQKVTIYFSTTGGYVTYYEILLDYINKNYKRITLIGTETLISCGFYIFYLAKCKKILFNNCTGMVHKISNKYEIKRKKSESDKIEEKETNLANDMLMQTFIELGMPLTLVERVFKDKENVYLSNYELNDLFFTKEEKIFDKILKYIRGLYDRCFFII